MNLTYYKLTLTTFITCIALYTIPIIVGRITSYTGYQLQEPYRAPYVGGVIIMSFGAVLLYYTTGFLLARAKGRSWFAGLLNVFLGPLGMIILLSMSDYALLKSTADDTETKTKSKSFHTAMFVCLGIMMLSLFYGINTIKRSDLQTENLNPPPAAVSTPAV